MIRFRRVPDWTAFLPLALGVCFAAHTYAQSAAPPPPPAASAVDTSQPPAYSEPPNYGPGVQGLRPGALPPNAFVSEDPTGLPYSSVPFLEQTGGDLNNWPSFRGNPFNTGIDQPAKIGSAEGTFSIGTGNFGFSPPFIQQGTEPDNADIKAGPFFIKFHDLDGLILYSDNYEHRQNIRRSETSAIISLNLSVIAQITDSIQFALSGAIVYLPLQNQVGFTGGSVYNALGILLYAAPFFAGQMSYDAMIAGWPVTFFDQFQVNNGRYAGNATDSFRYFKGDFITRDENGGYILHSEHASQTNAHSSNFASNYDATVLYLSNAVGAYTERMLPGDVHFDMGATHENVWYDTANSLPPSRDEFYAQLETQRPNMRFNVYLNYSASYVEGYPGITQQVTTGFFGPIDDQLFLTAGAGFYINAINHVGELYSLTLSHDAGPYTQEFFGIYRSLSDFNDFVITSEYYNIHQILGPTLNADLFLEQADVQDFVDGSNGSYSEEIAGLQFTWALGPKTSLGLAGIAEREYFDNGGRTDTFTGRAVLNRIVTDSLTFQILYQYQKSSSDISGDSYYENLVYFRFIYSFD